MLKLLLSLVSLLFLMSFSTAHGSSKVYRINSQNTIVVNTEINDSAYFNFSEALHEVKRKNVLIYIDSLGGSVLAGAQMIHLAQSMKQAKGLTYTCLIQNAASMAFAIVQSICDYRVVAPTSVLMQHQIAFGTGGQIERIDSLVRMVKDLERYFNQVQAKRLGMTEKAFRARITNDWYLVGADAITNKAADTIGYWLCSESRSCPLQRNTR